MHRSWLASIRSSPARWFVLLAAVGGVFTGWQARTPDITYWMFDTPLLAFHAQIFVSLATLGASAWQARADRQMGVQELSSTLPIGRGVQILISWGSVVAWGLVAYLSAVALLGAALARDAEWGLPDWRVVVHGACAVIAASAVGYALGSAFPTFLLIPVWVVAWFAIDGFLPLQASSIQWFAPRSIFENVDRSLYLATVPANIELKQAAWLISLALASLCFCTLALGRTKRRLLTVSMALTLLIVSSSVLLSVSGSVDFGSGRVRDIELACSRSQAVQVCLHPARRSLVEPTAAELARLLEPIHGLLGVPVTFTDAVAVDPTDGQVRIDLYSMDDVHRAAAISLAAALFPKMNDPRPQLSEAQAVILTWLYAQAGHDYGMAEYWVYTLDDGVSTLPIDEVRGRIVERARAFGVLTPDEQRRWLVEHLADLRSGAIAFEDLP